MAFKYYRWMPTASLFQLQSWFTQGKLKPQLLARDAMQNPSFATATDHDAPLRREFVKPTTLNGLLHAMCMIDEAMLEIDFDQQIELMENGKAKIDNYKYLIDKMKAMAEQFKAKADEYQTARRTLVNNVERLEQHLVYAMATNKFGEFAGHEYKAKLRWSEYVELKHSEPGDHHAINFPDLVKTSYDWKKTEIKKILKSEKPDERVQELAALKLRASVNFSVFKDV